MSKEMKEQIDAVLKLNAMDRANLGLSSTKAEKAEVIKMERQRLKSVRHLNPKLIDFLLKEDN